MSEADSVSKKRDKEAGKSEYKEGYTPCKRKRGGEREREFGIRFSPRYRGLNGGEGGLLVWVIGGPYKDESQIRKRVGLRKKRSKSDCADRPDGRRS